MANPLVREQSTAEFFRSSSSPRWPGSMCRPRTSPSSTWSTCSVSTCGIDGADRRGEHTQPLALRLARAIESGGSEQRARLRSIGDFSLFMSGFFSDSFTRAAVDIDYYKSMGEYAYGSLSRSDDDAFADVFGELSRKFVGFVDVLADISEHTTLAPGDRRRSGSTSAGCAPAASATDSGSSSAASCRTSRSASASFNRAPQ